MIKMMALLNVELKTVLRCQMVINTPKIICERYKIEWNCRIPRKIHSFHSNNIKYQIKRLPFPNSGIQQTFCLIIVSPPTKSVRINRTDSCCAKGLIWKLYLNYTGLNSCDLPIYTLLQRHLPEREFLSAFGRESSSGIMNHGKEIEITFIIVSFCWSLIEMRSTHWRFEVIP